MSMTRSERSPCVGKFVVAALMVQLMLLGGADAATGGGRTLKLLPHILQAKKQALDAILAQLPADSILPAQPLAPAPAATAVGALALAPAPSLASDSKADAAPEESVSPSQETKAAPLECSGRRIKCEDIHGGVYTYCDSGYIDYGNSRLNIPVESGSGEMSSDRKSLTVKAPSFNAQCELKRTRILEFAQDWTCQVTDGIEVLKNLGAVDITCEIVG